MTKQRMRRGAKYALAAVVVLSAGFWISYPKLKVFGEILTLGVIHHRVAQSTHRLPPVNKIEINLLQDAASDPRTASNEDYASQPGPGLFPIPTYGRWDKILSTAVATGKDAETIAEHWRFQHFSEGFSSLCHYPVYGLRFYNDKELVLETSICWKCRNVVLTRVGFWGFDATSREATNLLMELQRHIPLPANDQADSTE